MARLTGQKSVEMVGIDPKDESLTEKYGEYILSLPEDSLEEFRQDNLLPDLQNTALKTLGK